MKDPDKKASGSSAACMYRWDQIYNQIKPAYSRKTRCHWSENNHLMLQLKFVHGKYHQTDDVFFLAHVMFGGDAIAGCPASPTWPLHHQKGDWAAAQFAATLAAKNQRWVIISKAFFACRISQEQKSIIGWIMLDLPIYPPHPACNRGKQRWFPEN